MFLSPDHIDPDDRCLRTAHHLPQLGATAARSAISAGIAPAVHRVALKVHVPRHLSAMALAHLTDRLERLSPSGLRLVQDNTLIAALHVPAHCPRCAAVLAVVAAHDEGLVPEEVSAGTFGAAKPSVSYRYAPGCRLPGR